MSEAEGVWVRVELPANLCLLAGAPHEIEVLVTGLVTQRAVVDALEAMYPMLKGTIRHHASKVRRPFIRFFACGQDLSHMDMDEPLPESVRRGEATFLILGAIAGG